MIARGCSIEEAGNHICRYAEQLASGVLCSIVTVDRDGLIHPLAGSSISRSYSDALDGIKTGPGVGSCGTAAYLRVPVAVEDIFSDPLWGPYRSLADILEKEHGVRACWSSPIMRSDGRVLGAFGFYYKENRGPTSEERMIVAECVDLCSIVLEREEVKAENHRLAYFDTATGLGNRTNFINVVEEMAARAEDPFGILLIDIDQLGRINDTLGHAAGDKVIVQVANTVARIAGPVRTFRVDADEFAIIVETNAVSELPARSRDILRAVAQLSLQQGGHNLSLSVSCGGAIFRLSPPANDLTILQQANLALHHAKQTARGNFVLYTDDLAAAIFQRFDLLQTLKRALAENRIEPHYQPIIRLDTREIIGLEALCRVRTAEDAILSAGMFADALQDPSIGYLLTDRMLERVARDVKSWIKSGLPFQYVSVNVSMADFNQGGLRDRIRKAFARHDVAPGRIVVEVTESVYMDNSDRNVAAAIEGLRSDGFLVALDDFGTGYASLTHLLNFPVDIVKIDKTFVDSMLGGPGEIIIKALLDMAAGLGMRIIVEGVEIADQASLLGRLGCIFAQGYLFGRPVDRDQTTEALLLGAKSASLAAGH